MDELPIRTGDDVVRVRQQVRVVAAKNGLSLVDQTKVVTAASELARNALVHGGGGLARVDVVTSALGRNFGIAPVEAQACGTPVIAFGKGGATETVIDGETGLFFHEQTSEAIVKAVDEFELTSKPGGGTSVVVVKWSR